MLLNEWVLRLRSGFTCLNIETSDVNRERSDGMWSSVKCGDFLLVSPEGLQYAVIKEEKQ
jgi:hypothetical protein